MTDSFSFGENVYAVVRLIPYGRVSSYGAIARYLGSGRSSRMVGWVLNQSHTINPPIPAHRVVNRNGILSGKHHFSSPNAMEELLSAEGVMVKDDRVIEFSKLFWDPALELKL